MAIKIGTVESIGHAKNWSMTPDDRRTLIRTLDAPYVAVVGDGVKEQGHVYSFTATFTKDDWDSILKGYWYNGTLVDVVMDDGDTLASRRVVIKNKLPHEMFEKSYVDVTMELWGI